MALPDGRVLICGGSYTELVAGGRVSEFLNNTKDVSDCLVLQHGGINSTSCWYWIHGTTEIKPLEFYSKLPFEV